MTTDRLSLSWYLSVGGIYYVGKMEKHDDFCYFDKGQIVMARSCGVFLVCSGHYLTKLVPGRKSGQPVGKRQGHGLIDANGERRLELL